MASLRRSDPAGPRFKPITAKVASAPDEPEFDRGEVIVCMVLAFAIGNALLTIIYRLMG
jgi:hypothetical protein